MVFMSEKELTEKAWAIIKFVTKCTPLPPNLIWEEKADGKILLTYLISGRLGDSMIVNFLPPFKLIESILKDFAHFGIKKGNSVHFPLHLSEEMLDSLNESGNPLPLSNPPLLEEKLAVNFYHLLLSNLAKELEETFTRIYEFPALTFGEYAAIIKARTSPQEVNKGSVNTFEKRIEKFIDENTSRSLKRRSERGTRILKDKLNEIKKNRLTLQPQKNLMRYFYDLLHPRWIKAKDFYYRHKNSKNWQSLLYSEFNETLPLSLIERLSDPDKYISMPACIARLHAAKFCGYTDFIDNGSLILWVRQSRKWAKQNPENEEKLATKYFEETLLRIEIEKHFSNKVGLISDETLDRIPYFQQFIYRNKIDSLEYLHNVLMGDI